MFLRPNNEKITSDFIMCVCVYSKYIHLQNSSKTNDFLFQISRFVLLNYEKSVDLYKNNMFLFLSSFFGKLFTNTFSYMTLKSYININLYFLILKKVDKCKVSFEKKVSFELSYKVISNYTVYSLEIKPWQITCD